MTKIRNICLAEFNTKCQRSRSNRFKEVNGTMPVTRKERIKSDNLPVLFSFENDVIDTSQVLKIIIIQTAARQNYNRYVLGLKKTSTCTMILI